MTPQTVTSKDGTRIAYERVGKGPALVLVGGAFCDRHAAASGTPLAALLAHRFTVFSYDRRGRGDSADTKPYAIDRELEDLAAVLAAAGGAASVFGNSSGGLLAVDAAAQGLSMAKLAVYEPPVILDPGRVAAFEALVKRLEEAPANEAVELFLTQVVMMPAAVVAGMRKAPMWAGLEQISHTLSYDQRITVRGPARLEQLGAVRSPTLVMDGGSSPPWMREANRILATKIPGACHLTLEGQTHAVDPQALARAIEDFVG